mmetsp:Transcript_78783/g.231141  ORF Transcript_78783/g.231141 Transcript_78783/m.231141 type:complete len:285 (-) Transcript_78783:23-877(-)
MILISALNCDRGEPKMTTSAAGPFRNWSSITSTMSAESSRSCLACCPFLSLRVKRNVCVSSISLLMLDWRAPMNDPIMPMGTLMLRQSPAKWGGINAIACSWSTAAYATMASEAFHRCSRVPTVSTQITFSLSVVTDHLGYWKNSTLRHPLAHCARVLALCDRSLFKTLYTMRGGTFNSVKAIPTPLQGCAASARAAMLPLANSSKETMMLTSVARRAAFGPKIAARQDGLVLETSTSSVEPSQHHLRRTLPGPGRPKTTAMYQVPGEPGAGGPQRASMAWPGV